MNSDLYAVDAPFYDIIHDSLVEDIGLWQSLAGRTDKPVLEIGAGTGRITVALALAGYSVVGIDASPAMLGRARQRAESAGIDISFIEGRLPDLVLEAAHYGLAIFPLDVFLYCEDAEEQLVSLRLAAEALHFNGLLALDLPGPALWLDPDSNGQPILVFSGTGPDGGPFDAWQLHEDDLARQTRLLRVTYEQLGSDGIVRRTQAEHELRYLYPFECEHLLQRAGLALVDVYGDYDLGPLTNDSERMILLARKAAG